MSLSTDQVVVVSPPWPACRFASLASMMLMNATACPATSPPWGQNTPGTCAGGSAHTSSPRRPPERNTSETCLLHNSLKASTCSACQREAPHCGPGLWHHLPMLYPLFSSHQSLHPAVHRHAPSWGGTYVVSATWLIGSIHVQHTPSLGSAQQTVPVASLTRPLTPRIYT